MAKIHIAHAFDIIATCHHIPLSPKEMLTLLSIATCTDHNGIASIPTQTLALMIRGTVLTAKRLVRQLEEKGCISVTPDPHPEGKHLYRILHDEECP